MPKKRKIIPIEKCGECPWYEWRSNDAKLGFCEIDDPRFVLTSKENKLVYDQSPPDWCPLPDFR